ncbi:unnamed protein product [Scytosiphon promiscuus]
MAELGEELPFLQPALKTLTIIREKAETVQSIPEESSALAERCTHLTACVVVKCRRVSSEFDVTPLDDRLREVAKFVERSGRRGRVSRVLKASHDKAEIDRLHASLDRLTGDLGLAGIATVEEKVDTILARQARLQAGSKLAAVPKGVPMGESWHTTREGAMDCVCDMLGGDGPPTLAALTGRSGSGKTTAAAAMVGERGPTRPRAGETEGQARTRLDRVRALFPQGVVWLRVGKREGAADRLPVLMRKLAKAFHQDAMNMSVRAPMVDEDGDSYVNAIVSQGDLRCLVVADDVWEQDVIEKLRNTGLWVLLTTRDSTIVKPHEVVVLDELTATEAEGVLRGAARLPMDERLNDDAAKILEICGRVAMDIAFVGSWGSVRTGEDGVLKSRGAWADVTRQIEAEIIAVRGSAPAAGKMADVSVSRLAVLRAGFKHLGAQHPLAQELYLALAVFPNGYAFEKSAAAVILHDVEAFGDHHLQIAMAAVATLERWAVLRADTSGLCHLGVCVRLLGRPKKAEELLTRALGIQTAKLEQDNLLRALTLHELGICTRQLGRPGEAEKFLEPALAIRASKLDPCDLLVAFTLHELGECVREQQRPEEAQTLFRRALDIKTAKLPQGHILVASTLQQLGRCQRESGRPAEAERSITRALEIKEEKLGPEDVQVAVALQDLGRCVQAVGRPGQAESLFGRSLKILEGKLGADDPQVAFLLKDLGECLLKAGDAPRAEQALTRALGILEARLDRGADEMTVACVLHDLGRCARVAGRPEDAEGVLRRALEIKEARLGPYESQVSVTLYELALCARAAGQPGKAEAFLKRVLQIGEAKLPGDDMQLGAILQELGRCVWEAGRRRDTGVFLERALGIAERNLGPDSLQVAVMVHELGLCRRAESRHGESIKLLRRALKIKQAHVGPSHPEVANTVKELGCCLREAGRMEDAQLFLKQALEVKEENLGSEHPEVDVLRHELALCVRKARLATKLLRINNVFFLVFIRFLLAF